MGDYDFIMPEPGSITGAKLEMALIERRIASHKKWRRRRALLRVKAKFGRVKHRAKKPLSSVSGLKELKA